MKLHPDQETIAVLRLALTMIKPQETSKQMEEVPALLTQAMTTMVERQLM